MFVAASHAATNHECTFCASPQRVLARASRFPAEGTPGAASSRTFPASLQLADSGCPPVPDTLLARGCASGSPVTARPVNAPPALPFPQSRRAISAGAAAPEPRREQRGQGPTLRWVARLKALLQAGHTWMRSRPCASLLCCSSRADEAKLRPHSVHGCSRPSFSGGARWAETSVTWDGGRGGPQGAARWHTQGGQRTHVHGAPGLRHRRRLLVPSHQDGTCRSRTPGGPGTTTHRTGPVTGGQRSSCAPRPLGPAPPSEQQPLAPVPTCHGRGRFKEGEALARPGPAEAVGALLSLPGTPPGTSPEHMRPGRSAAHCPPPPRTSARRPSSASVHPRPGFQNPRTAGSESVPRTWKISSQVADAGWEVWLTRMTCGEPTPPGPESEGSASKAGNCWPWEQDGHQVRHCHVTKPGPVQKLGCGAVTPKDEGAGPQRSATEQQLCSRCPHVKTCAHLTPVHGCPQQHRSQRPQGTAHSAH